MSKLHGIGVDGCPAGWVMAEVKDGVAQSIEVYASIASLYAVAKARASVLLIDIPIGLSEGGRDGRLCDRLGREALGPRRSSLFPTPSRPVLSAPSYEAACSAHQAATGTKISKQAWFLIPKIREVDAFLQSDAYGRTRLRECHPELAFACINRGEPMPYPKKHPLGFLDRLRALEAKVSGVEDALRDALDRFGTKVLVADDVLDAMVLAYLSSLGPKALSTLPPKPPKDGCGLPMELVYRKVDGARNPR